MGKRREGLSEVGGDNAWEASRRSELGRAGVR